MRKRKADWLYDEPRKRTKLSRFVSRTSTPGLVPSCAEGGVLGILPGIIGCIQANEVVKIILGIGRTLSGRMLSYDALSMTFREFKLQRNPSTPAITELIDYQQFCGFGSIEEESVEPFLA